MFVLHLRSAINMFIPISRAPLKGAQPYPQLCTTQKIYFKTDYRAAQCCTHRAPASQVDPARSNVESYIHAYDSVCSPFALRCWDATWFYVLEGQLLMDTLTPLSVAALPVGRSVCSMRLFILTCSVCCVRPCFCFCPLSFHGALGGGLWPHVVPGRGPRMVPGPGRAHGSGTQAAHGSGTRAAHGSGTRARA